MQPDVHVSRSVLCKLKLIPQKYFFKQERTESDVIYIRFTSCYCEGRGVHCGFTEPQLDCVGAQRGAGPQGAPCSELSSRAPDRGIEGAKGGLCTQSCDVWVQLVPRCCKPRQPVTGTQTGECNFPIATLLVKSID